MRHRRLQSVKDDTAVVFCVLVTCFKLCKYEILAYVDDARMSSGSGAPLLSTRSQMYNSGCLKNDVANLAS